MKGIFLFSRCSGMRILLLVFICTQMNSYGFRLNNGRLGLRIAGKKERLFFAGKLPASWSSLDVSEPGYDFTQAEMIRLKIWPNGIIPYYIDDFSFDHTFSERLRDFLRSVNGVTGLRFTELSHPPEYKAKRWVLFINRRGLLPCEDYTTRSFTNQGVQRVILGYDCINAATDGSLLAPLVLALAGVPPQHNAPDRDKFITVVMDNIIPEKRHLFEKVKNNEWIFDPVKYDFFSAGHYDFHKYTLNGFATIIPKEKVDGVVGEAEGVSFEDVWKIRMLYNFISLERPQVQTSDCSKLFKPAKKFDKYTPESAEVRAPRIKPARYKELNLDIDDDKTGTDHSNFKPPDSKKLKINLNLISSDLKITLNTYSSEVSLKEVSPTLNTSSLGEVTTNLNTSTLVTPLEEVTTFSTSSSATSTPATTSIASSLSTADKNKYLRKLKPSQKV